MPDIICDVCRQPLRPEARFCSSCGPISRDLPPPMPRTQALKSDVHWKALIAAAYLFGFLLASSLIGGLAQKFTKSPWCEIGIDIIDAVVVFGFAVRHLRDLTPVLRLHAIRPRRILEILFVSAAVAMTLILYFWILEKLGVPTVSLVSTYVKSSWNTWIVVGSVVVAPPIVEELAFRGIIQSRLDMILNPMEANVVQAACFAVLHLSPLVFVSHFMMGLYLGYLRRRSGTIHFGIVAHALWNASVLNGELRWF